MSARKAVEPGLGHNGGPIMGAAKDQLKDLLTRIENVIDEDLDPAKAAIKDIYEEAKVLGFSPKMLRKIVALRSKDKGKLMEENSILQLYAHALGVEDLV